MPDPVKTSTPTPQKAGIKTSEFWVALLIPFIGGAAMGVNEWLQLGFPKETIYAFTGTGVTYIIGRILLKLKA